MNIYLYIASVFGKNHGEYLGTCSAFDIDNFNAVFITEFEAKYYCIIKNAYKVDFGTKSIKDICNILKDYNIIPLMSSINNLKEVLEDVYKDNPEFSKFMDSDFVIKDEKDFISNLNNNNKIKFRISSVIVGTKQ